MPYRSAALTGVGNMAAAFNRWAGEDAAEETTA